MVKGQQFGPHAENTGAAGSSANAGEGIFSAYASAAKLFDDAVMRNVFRSNANFEIETVISSQQLRGEERKP